jgi:siroheme synthase
MGGRTVSANLQRLLAAGLDADTPALVVSAATTARRKHAFCRVRELEGVIGGLEITDPCLVMIGRAIRPLMPASPTEPCSAQMGSSKLGKTSDQNGASQALHTF